MVKMKVGGQTLNFMLDTGAEHSVLTQKVEPLSGWKVTTMGPQPVDHSVAPNNASWGGHQVVH